MFHCVYQCENMLTTSVFKGLSMLATDTSFVAPVTMQAASIGILSSGFFSVISLRIQDQ